MVDGPIEIFRDLFDRASRSSAEADAMVLSTVGTEGHPSSRYVLLKEFDERGFTFYTNLGSRKARDLGGNPFASLCFYWATIEKQVRIEGRVERVTDAEADAYFETRPRDSQIAAWASAQSSPLESLAALEERVAEMRARFEGRPVPRPPFWSGFRVVPQMIEFWSRLPARLHERVRYDLVDRQWVRSLLYP